MGRGSSEDSSQGVEHGVSSLAHGGEIAANATKGSRPDFTSESARDFLLHFEHAQIALRLIVYKRFVVHLARACIVTQLIVVIITMCAG